MIKNRFDDLYIGVTDDPQKRLKYHNEKRGALFTKRDPEFCIVFLEQYPTLADARKREIQIKKWRREKKDMLIERYRRGCRQSCELTFFPSTDSTNSLQAGSGQAIFRFACLNGLEVSNFVQQPDLDNLSLTCFCKFYKPEYMRHIVDFLQRGSPSTSSG